MSEHADATVRRAYQVYLYAVCFVTVLVVVFGVAEAVYGLVRIIAPETTGPSSGIPIAFPSGGDRSSAVLSALGRAGSAERRAGVAQLIQSGLLAGAAYAAFRFHWQRSVELRAELEAAPVAPKPAVEPSSEAVAPITEILPAKPAPRKRAAPKKRR